MREVKVGSRNNTYVRLVLMPLIFLMGAILAGVFVYSEFQPPNLKTPIVWHGIAPGKTEIAEAIELWGVPTDVEMRENSFVVYEYRDHKEWGWDLLELWIKGNVVEAILLGGPDMTKWPVMPEPYLIDFVLEYGRPEKVTWAGLCRERILIWAHNGIAVSTDANTYLHTWETFAIADMLIFKPMSIQQFLSADWPTSPYIGKLFYETNPCAEDNPNGPDPFPEDPYDWDHMPTPAATAMP